MILKFLKSESFSLENLRSFPSFTDAPLWFNFERNFSCMSIDMYYFVVKNNYCY